MYLGIDIGGTKTIVASLDDNGVIQESFRFPTPQKYQEFLEELAENVDKLTTKEFVAAGAGVPYKIDRVHGIAIAGGRLPWVKIPIKKDIQKITHCPTVIDNDANLAGLSEAMLLKEFRRVLYVTISTGIGTGYVVDQKIDPTMADSEGGEMIIEHGGKLEPWEDFASGQAIVRRFGKRASEITDKDTWRAIAHDISVGLIDLIAVVQPDVIVLGGGVGAHYDKYGAFLDEYLKKFETPLLPIPPIRQAARPELAVVYGSYDLAKGTYGKAS
ncbi:MAG: ROK family protein [Candidatus Saccharimonadales bacterium]|jgi:predicted NBD/HSP70 family sugar kinase